MDQGPPVNLLSGKQLRLLARIKTLRPTAELRWKGDGSGWSLVVIQPAAHARSKPLLEARLGVDGTVKTTHPWI